MPASLLSLKIRGVRSYSPYEHKSQSIDFMPLTLIVGSNGHGKTTLIESLKFVISGEEPPLSDSRRNFLHSSKEASATKFDKKSSYALIELEFQNARDQLCSARREIFQPASTAKTATPSISSGYRIGKGKWNHVHKQDDWSKTIPTLFNLPSQAMLNNVILCHQEENLWSMGDSNSVKQIFDRIFGCESYKKEIKNIETELKHCKQDLQVANKELTFQLEKVERKKYLQKEEIKLSADIEKINKDITDLEQKTFTKGKERDVLNKEVMALNEKRVKLKTLTYRISESSKRIKELNEALGRSPIDRQTLSDEEIEKKLKDHSSFVEQTKLEQIRLDEKARSLKVDKANCEYKKSCLQKEINHLKVTELKSQDTLENLTRQLEQISLEQSIDGITTNDLDASFKILEKFEQKLRQIKCDKSEQEIKLSREQQALTKHVNKLEIVYSDLKNKIVNREKFIEKLLNQLAQSDPVAKDLVIVADNLVRISEIAAVLPPMGQVEVLKALVKDSSRIIDSLVVKFQKDGVIQMENDIEKEKSEIDAFKKDLVKIKKQKEEQSDDQTKLDTEQSALRTASKDAHNKMVTFNQALQNLKHSYKTYIDEKKLLASKNIDTKLKEAECFDNRISKINEELNLLDLEHSKLSEEYRKSFELLEEYKTNIQLRQAEKQFCEIQTESTALKEEVGDESHFTELHAKLREIEFAFWGLRDERSTLIGSKNQIAPQLNRIAAELDGLSKVNSRYAEVNGKVICNKIIINDLEKLKICFDQSITAFHNQMIIKINEALRARWRQIYKGSDIRYIELVDEEIKRGDKKSFNYYVAMHKGNLKMKMREKSSAGQKALASIILRMTLAELFIKDFAFIALDEPTSNLDFDNVLSLAKAIGSYVKKRAVRGTNIQWIIITHDEQFLRALDAECSPYYYKVELDSEGCSKIIKISYQDARLFSKESSQAGSSI